jgi:hypothetical protein
MRKRGVLLAAALIVCAPGLASAAPIAGARFLAALASDIDSVGYYGYGPYGYYGYGPFAYDGYYVAHPYYDYYRPFGFGYFSYYQTYGCYSPDRYCTYGWPW